MKRKTKSKWFKEVEAELSAMDPGPSATTEDGPVPRKTLSLRYLKMQVDAAMEAHRYGVLAFRDCGPDWNPETGLLWLIGDFEIRRRK
jgi:hypothetical protein